MDHVARLRSNVIKLYQSTTLRATLTFAFAGVAYMVGSLLLARHLSALEFASVALFLAFTQIGTSLGMAGSETIVVRHGLSPTVKLLATVTGFACLVGVLLFVVGHLAYDMTLPLAAIMFAAALTSALVRFESAFFQSRQKFRASLFLHQAHNFVLLGVALCALIFGIRGAVVPCLLMALCFLLMTGWGWHAAVRSYAGTQVVAIPYPWREALPILAFGAANVLSFQAERLLIPQLLSVELLATYSVLAALAASPFQMLMAGVGHTMMPRLKNSTSPEHRRRIVRNELLLVLAVTLPGAAVVLFLSPYLAELLTAGKYTLSQALVGASVLTGLGKVFNGFVSAVLRALGTTRDLRLLGSSAWFGLLVAVLVAIPAARYGLVGIVLAGSLGWLARLIILLPPTMRVLAERTGVQR